FDGVQRLGYRVGVGTDIARVDHLLDAERLDVERRVVNRAQHPGRLANRFRTETGARPVACAGIEGHAENRNRSLRNLANLRQAGEGSTTGKAWHLASVDWTDDAVWVLEVSAVCHTFPSWTSRSDNPRTNGS